jgi:hypothetical protein
MKTEDLLFFAAMSNDIYRRPWNYEGKTYVTDRAIILVLPEVGGIVPHKYPQIAAEVAKCVKGYERLSPLYPLPTLPVPANFCEDCVQWYYASQPIEWGGMDIDAKYIFKLYTLPNCRLSKTGKYEPHHFTFDGGEGWLMPLKEVFHDL